MNRIAHRVCELALEAAKNQVGSWDTYRASITSWEEKD